MSWTIWTFDCDAITTCMNEQFLRLFEVFRGYGTLFACPIHQFRHLWDNDCHIVFFIVTIKQTLSNKYRTRHGICHNKQTNKQTNKKRLGLEDLTENLTGNLTGLMTYLPREQVPHIYHFPICIVPWYALWSWETFLPPCGRDRQYERILIHLCERILLRLLLDCFCRWMIIMT